MAQEITTVARPYAEAIFLRAKETSTIDQWTDKLAFLVAVFQDEKIQQLITSPGFDKAGKAKLLSTVTADHLDKEGQNLVHLLVENGRLIIVPAIAERFEQLKSQEQGKLDVQVTSAFPLNDEQQQSISKVLKIKLGRDVNIVSEEDPELIGGIHIRAGDLVIDGTVQGQLAQLANEIGI